MSAGSAFAGAEGLRAAGADVDALARALLSTGVLNWAGPATVVLVCSDGAAAMSPGDARAAVDFAFATPRPSLTLELAGADGPGRAAAWLALEYAERKAEWGKRGLALSVRARTSPPDERRRDLAARRAALVLEADADGAPGEARLFAADRALVRVGPGARDPEAWTDALGRRGVGSVRWLPASPRPSSRDAERFAEFCGRAFARTLESPLAEGLVDERAAALLAARPWEVPGLELLETLCCGPDGRVFASEAGRALALAGDPSWVLGETATLRFDGLAELPAARAVAASAWRPGHPECAGCPYRALCALPASDRGGLGGGVSESLWCAVHRAVLGNVFASQKREKYWKALGKYGVDNAKFPC